MRDGYKVIDMDTHVNPSIEVLEKYVEPGFRPRLAELKPYYSVRQRSRPDGTIQTSKTITVAPIPYDRFPGEELATFLRGPHARYPDGRMPRLPFSPETSRDLAAFLLLWSKPAQVDASASPPTQSEVRAVARRLWNGLAARWAAPGYRACRFNGRRG